MSLKCPILSLKGNLFQYTVICPSTPSELGDMLPEISTNQNVA
jgi:hypothetical protein